MSNETTNTRAKKMNAIETTVASENRQVENTIHFHGTVYSSANFARLLRRYMQNKPLYAWGGLRRERIVGVRINRDGMVILETMAGPGWQYSGQGLDNGVDQIRGF